MRSGLMTTRITTYLRVPRPELGKHMTMKVAQGGQEVAFAVETLVRLWWSLLRLVYAFESSLLDVHSSKIRHILGSYSESDIPGVVHNLLKRRLRILPKQLHERLGKSTKVRNMYQKRGLSRKRTYSKHRHFFIWLWSLLRVLASWNAHLYAKIT